MMYTAFHPADRSATQSGTVVDLRFELRGERLPADYSVMLAEAVLRHLPWLADEPGAGIHPVRGAFTGAGTLGLSRRTRLVLRVPRARVQETLTLQGRALELGSDSLEVGPAKPWPVTANPTLYARRVIAGPEDEIPFMAMLAELLRALAVDCETIVGKRSTISTPQGELGGFSVLLHGIKPAQSLNLQEQGLGAHRLYGCGIVVPHKSVTAVAG